MLIFVFQMMSMGATVGLVLGHSLPPRITGISDHTSVLQGNIARLDCLVEYVGKDFTVLWIKIADINGRTGNPIILTSGGTRVTLDTKVTVKSQSNQQYTLELRDISVQDSGIYQCQISTDPVIHKEVKLEVQYPPKILDAPPDKYAKEGDNVTLNCIANGLPHPKIYWQRLNNDILPMGGLKYFINIYFASRFPRYLGSEMIIQNLTRANRGVYMCVAISDIGKDERVISLSMEFAPKIITEKRKLSISEYHGKRAQLECDVEGEPKANVHWTFQRLEIHGPNYKTTLLDVGQDTVRNLLTIKNIGPQDYGEYTCTSVNNFGRDEKKFILHEPLKGYGNNANSSNTSGIFIIFLFFFLKSCQRIFL